MAHVHAKSGSLQGRPVDKFERDKVVTFQALFTNADNAVSAIGRFYVHICGYMRILYKLWNANMRPF